MRVRGKNLQALYQTFSDVYRGFVGSSFDYQTGEKGKVKRAFTHCSEAMSTRDEEDFSKVLKVFAQFLEKKAAEWLQWSHRSRNNYIGFICKKEEIEIYVQGEITEAPAVKDKLKIAGTQTSDEYEW